jgi:adenylate cyclase
MPVCQAEPGIQIDDCVHGEIPPLFVLVAHGLEPRQRWREILVGGRTYVLGRDADSDLPVAWDAHISRQHARLTVDAGRLIVEKLPSARNAIYCDGLESQRFTLEDGKRFVIGTTMFSFERTAEISASPSAGPVEEVTFDRQELKKVRFRDADRRFDVLTRLHEVIWGARTQTELHQLLASLILAGVGNAEAVALVEIDERGHARTLHWDRRREAAGTFRPSSRLIDDSLRRRHRSVLHLWESSKLSDSKYTLSAEFDWAYCTPLTDGGVSWGIYVAGALERPFVHGQSSRTDGIFLEADVKFTELVAEIVSSVLRLNRYERQKSGLRQFFAPPILAALGDDLDTALLEPRECDVTVLFCDLRGFSQKAEAAAGDLRGLLDRVSRALGVMTSQILKHGGVTGDFQGDAAMGFWGWPFASAEAPIAACRAALGIRAAFGQTFGRPDHPLGGFQVGIGVAHGRAVAGKIGTAEQVKVTVFGPVVNLASRLEGMTKQLRVPIVLDEATAAIVNARMDRKEGRTRRLARVLPYGTETPVLVSELLPSAREEPLMTDEQLALYDQAVDHFIAGRWDEAYRFLHLMPAGDRAQDFLGALIAQHNRVPPSGWDGAVHLSNK